MFFHNEGFSTACGHGTIALVTWAIETGRVGVAPDGRDATVTVDVPSGRLACTARLDEDGRVEAVRFRNVPSFVLARDVAVRTRTGSLTLDVAFGGAFYATLGVEALGLRVEPPAFRRSSRCSGSCARPSSGRSTSPIPRSPISRGIYGVIFWEALGPPRSSGT